MSVSLLVLRLEIADGCSRPNLEFCASGFQVTQIMSSNESSDPTCNQSEGPIDSSPIPDQVQRLYRGQRQLNTVSIETFQKGDIHSKHTNTKDHHASSTDEPSQWLGKIGFFSGNPTVETVKGVLHIYKNNEMTSLSKGISRSQTICMLGVPATIACIDLLQFVAPSEEYIENIKIIRDATPSQYMCLIKFKNQELADEFYDTYNGQCYNSLEEEVCHLVYVAKVEVLKSSEGSGLPIPGLTELPKCPVCLERMDESVEGVLTILCNHSFHGSCLSKWADTSCPVCRYVQTPEPSSENKCFKCDATESLWICLICGYVGCGRYASCHAYEHYKETQHTYSLELGSQRVWDYAGDNYVHRLIQNKTDGKLVEYGPARDQLGDEEKLDSLTLEYTYLLTNQLENQRMYFQEKITQIETDAADQISGMEERTKETMKELQKLEVKLADVEKEKKSIEKKYSQTSSKVGKLENQLKEERELNKCLRENQQLWHDKVTVMEQKLQETERQSHKEILDLQEQINDLMRHFETQQAISCAPQQTRQELQDGHIVLGEPSTDKKTKTRRKKR